jgi:hypothetical protein
MLVTHRFNKLKVVVDRTCKLNSGWLCQGTLTEGEASVQLTSSIRQLVL